MPSNRAALADENVTINNPRKKEKKKKKKRKQGKKSGRHFFCLKAGAQQQLERLVDSDQKHTRDCKNAF